MYRIPISGAIYVGTTTRDIGTHIVEHSRSCHYGQVNKSAVDEYTLTQDIHRILSKNTQVLDGISR